MFTSYFSEDCLHAEGGDIVSAVSSMFSETKSEPVDSSIDDVSASTEAKSDISAQMAYFGERSKSSLVLLCFEDALLLCSLKSVIQVSNLIFFLFNKLKYIYIFFSQQCNCCIIGDN